MKLKRIIMALPRAAAMGALAPMERRLLRAAPDTPPRAVFIVGPPRSGTTLLYEAMVTRFRFAYFSNIAHRLHRTPAAATKLGAGAIRNWTGDFQSRYGHISGWGSPNEGGWIWKRWIPEEHALDESDAAGRPVDEIRRTVGAISAIIGAPFLNKNVMHSVHMRLLDAIFPQCLFIECRRNATDTARSIIKARIDEFGEGGVSEWLSVRPDGWREFAEEPPAAQAIAQVMLTQQSIESDTAVLGPHRLIRINYEDFCAAPEQNMLNVQAFLREHGVTIEDCHELPDFFPRSRGAGLRDTLESEMAEASRRWGAAEGVAVS